MLKILLGLRNNAHQVEVIKPNGTVRPVLGTRDPEEENRRKNVVKQWGGAAESPRQQKAATIDLPLSQRSQTILSYRVSESVRQRLNGGIGKQADSRRHNQEASTEPVDVTPPNSEE